MDMQFFREQLDRRGKETCFRELGESTPEPVRKLIRCLSLITEARDPIGRKLLDALYGFPQIPNPQWLYFGAGEGDGYTAYKLGTFHSHGYNVFPQDLGSSLHFLNKALESENPWVRNAAQRERQCQAFQYSDFELSRFDLDQYKGDAETVAVPNMIRDVGYDAFRNNTSVRHIILPESVRVIRYRAFAGCTNLETVYLPESLEIIEECAFEGCVNLKQIRLPEKLYHLGYSAFQGCKSLEEITLPGRLGEIGSSTFCDAGLKRVRFGSGIRRIGPFAFYDCPLTHISWVREPEKIARFAFSGEFRSIAETVPPELTMDQAPEPGKVARELVKMLVSWEGLDEEVRRRVLGAAYGMNPRLVEEGAAAGDPKARMTLAAWKASGLRGMARDINGARKLLAETRVPQDLAEEMEREKLLLSASRPKLALLRTPSKGYSLEGDTLILHCGERTVAANAFQKNTDIRRVILPEGLVALEEGAFRGCSKLEEVYLPASLKDIGREAFADCVRLKVLELPQGLERLGESAFQNCHSLTEADIPGTVRVVPRSAFQKAGLTEVTLRMGIHTVEKHAFRDCPLLDLICSRSLKLVEAEAFLGCDKTRMLEFYDLEYPYVRQRTEVKKRNPPFRASSAVTQYYLDLDLNSLVTVLGGIQSPSRSCHLHMEGLPSREEEKGYEIHISESPMPYMGFV